MTVSDLISRVCPFCHKVHIIRNAYLNIICECGGKYYTNTGVWLNRNTGEKVSNAIKFIKTVNMEGQL